MGYGLITMVFESEVISSSQVSPGKREGDKIFPTFPEFELSHLSAKSPRINTHPKVRGKKKYIQECIQIKLFVINIDFQNYTADLTRKKNIN